MNTTIADKLRSVDPEDLIERARLHRLEPKSIGDAAAQIVPMFAESLSKTQRFLAFVAAMLITLFLACVFTLFLAWVFARALGGVPFGPAQVVARTDAATYTRSTDVGGRDVTAPSLLSS